MKPRDPAIVPLSERSLTVIEDWLVWYQTNSPNVELIPFSYEEVSAEYALRTQED